MICWWRAALLHIAKSCRISCNRVTDPRLVKGIPLLDTILGYAQSAIWLVILVVALLVVGVYIKTRYKVPSAGEALVITGGKKGMRVLPGGGGFVSPLRKHQFFPLKVMTVQSENKETQTITLVPVVVQWTAQLRADTETEGALVKAVTGFADHAVADIMTALRQTLDGEVRAVVAKLTPEQVVQDKDTFSGTVKEGVVQRMTELGFQLVSLNIAEVDDKNNYYKNAAAKDREERRQEAETLTAQANQSVAVAQAQSDEIAQSAVLERDLKVAEKTREVTLRKAEIQVETDVAQANAEIAGQLQRTVRSQELAAREGEVAVVREQQNRAAAAARREVEITEAETSKQRDVITAESMARQTEIEAQAAANVAKATAEGQANADAARARGEAQAEIARAEGKASAISKTTEARTDEIRRTGLAAAEVAQAQGEAEAAATLARGKAEAEAQRLMADALAANEGANLRVTLAKIERDTTVTVYTTVGQAMANIGEKATFIDMGGSSNGEDDLFSKVLGKMPELFKRLDVKNGALNGTTFGGSLGTVIADITSGQPAAGVSQTTDQLQPDTSHEVVEEGSDLVHAHASVEQPSGESHEDMPADRESTE